ncbi:MAG: hypothetical protein ACR2HX_00500 [Pyrinomonadaceae bacterium]
MSLANLHYGVAEEWETLPDWASYFLFLGFFIASQPKTETRSVIGVALPTRAFAAALAATGVVYNRTVLTKNRVDAESHFQMLCQLPSGAPITYLHGKRNLNGLLLGCTDKFGEKRLIIQIPGPKSSAETHYVRPADAEKIQRPAEVSQITKTSGMPSKRQTGQLVTPVSEFTQALLGGENATDLSHRSRLECSIIGQLSALRKEITQTAFSIFTESTSSQLVSKPRFHEGMLQDVLRARKFLGEGKAYRTDVVASQSQNVPMVACDIAPHVTIFDGSTGFTKWRDYWRSSHWLVLIESTESGFDDAVRALNTGYITNRIEDGAGRDMPLPPEGVELVFYREKLGD